MSPPAVEIGCKRRIKYKVRVAGRVRRRHRRRRRCTVGMRVRVRLLTAVAPERAAIMERSPDPAPISKTSVSPPLDSWSFFIAY